MHDRILSECLKAWIYELFLKCMSCNYRFVEEKFIQLLKANLIESPEASNKSVILVSDSDVQLYATIRYDPSVSMGKRSLKQLSEQNCIIKVSKFKFITEKINDFLPPILDILNFQIVDYSGLPIGQPIFIQDRPKSVEQTKYLNIEQKILDSLGKFMTTIPKGIYIPDFCSTQAMETFPTKIYEDFSNFCMCYERAVLDKYLRDFRDNMKKNYFSKTQKIEEYDRHSVNDQNNDYNSIACSKEISDVFVSDIDKKAQGQTSIPESCSDPINEAYLALDKCVLTFCASNYNFNEVDDKGFNILLDIIRKDK